MGIALSTIRDEVESGLRDSSNDIWSTSQIDTQIKKAISEVNAYLPKRMRKIITTNGEELEVDLVCWPRMTWVEKFEIEIDEDPREYRNAFEAGVPMYEIDWSDDPTRVAISSIASGGTGLITVTTSSAHGLAAGDLVTITGTTNYNVENAYVTAVPSTTTLTTIGDFGATETGYIGQLLRVFMHSGYYLGEDLDISSISGEDVITIETSTPHFQHPGDSITVSGVGATAYNDTYTVMQVTDEYTMKVSGVGHSSSASSGTCTTQGSSSIPYIARSLIVEGAEAFAALEWVNTARAHLNTTDGAEYAIEQADGYITTANEGENPVRDWIAISRGRQDIMKTIQSFEQTAMNKFALFRQRLAEHQIVKSTEFYPR